MASFRRLRLLTGLLAVAATAGGGASAPSASAGSPPVQRLAALLAPHKVFAAPRVRPSRVGRIAASRPITGAQTVLPVIGHTTTKDGVRWLWVMLPGRPNGLRGWIAERATVRTATSWRVVVRTASRRVLVYSHGRLVRTFKAVVGKPSTPTPHGTFFVEESIQMLSGVPGGPFALALSARSNVLQEFDGGPGQIAIHGIANLGGTPGTAASHGCVRLDNRNVTWLAARVGAGALVTITS